MFTSAANAADLGRSNDENSNGGGDSSDDDAENSTNQKNNAEEEFDPSRIEHFLLIDSDDEINEHHTGADGELAQINGAHVW